jgi:glycosyltransferase involved in cell wall biosynthesis
MIVVYLHQFFFPWERAHSVLMLRTGAGLAAHGVSTHLLAKPNPTFPISSVADGLRFYGIPESPHLHIHLSPTASRRRASWWNLRRTLEILRRNRRQRCIVLVNKFFTARKIAFIRRLTRLRFRLVLEMQEIPSLLERPYAEVEELIRRPARPAHHQPTGEDRDLRGVDGVVCITDAGCVLLDRVTSFDGPVVTLRNGVDLRAYAGNGPQSSARSEKIVLYVGHLWDWKGVDILIESLAYLPPDVSLRLVGGEEGGDRTRKLKERCQELGVQDRVDFRGFVPHANIAQMYQEASCLVLPNNRTVMGGFFSSPMKVFEYMATGLPIVATDLPAIREVLRHEETAILAKPDDPMAMAAGIRRVVEDRALAAKVAARARIEVEEYTWERRAERLMRFFESLP